MTFCEKPRIDNPTPIACVECECESYHTNMDGLCRGCVPRCNLCGLAIEGEDDVEGMHVDCANEAEDQDRRSHERSHGPGSM